MNILGALFGYVFRWCYILTNHFFWAIVIFTAISKVVLFPISLLAQKNSIVMVKIEPALTDIQERYADEPETILKEQKALYRREHYSTIKAILPLLLQIPIILGVIAAINHPERYIGHIDHATFCGLDLLANPTNLIVPVLAIASTILLCVIQNVYNVVSREQGFIGKWGTTIFLTAFTGWFSFATPQGVGLYWTLSNLMAIGVLAICNIIYNPKKYIDYSNRTVKPKLTKAQKQEKRDRKRIERTRTKEDMARFKANAPHELVFYSEASGFYKYFRGYIEYILNHSDITVDYITSDLNDQVFGMRGERFKPYFCSAYGMITEFMELDCDICVMTMPDLETYQYKRSLVRKDIEYIYADHGLGSFHLALRKGALDHFDTIYCYSKNHDLEVRATEACYGLPAKKLVDVGFGLFDTYRYEYEHSVHPQHDKPQILIAPSWQPGNILELCLDELINGLSSRVFSIIIRPHPEFVKRFPDKMARICDRYTDRFCDDFVLQTDFSSNDTVYNSDLLITDWSTIAPEFSFTTGKPSMYINTPMKVMNPEWEKIGLVPLEISLRDILGQSVEMDNLGEAGDVAQKLMDNRSAYKVAIDAWMRDNLYNYGNEAQAGGTYIMDAIAEKRRCRQ